MNKDVIAFEIIFFIYFNAFNVDICLVLPPITLLNIVMRYFFKKLQMLFVYNNKYFLICFILLNFVKECSKSVFPPILTNGFGILELNLLLSPAANKIKQKLIILIYLIFM